MKTLRKENGQSIKIDLWEGEADHLAVLFLGEKKSQVDSEVCHGMEKKMQRDDG